MKLTGAQQVAVDFVGGPLLIVAGAGVGKTTVITEKIRMIMETNKAKADQVLALTFSEKAAEEMVARLDTVLPYGYSEPWVMTFHRFGERVLRNDGLEMGLDPGYRIMTQMEQFLLVRKSVFELGLDYYRPLGNPGKFVWSLVRMFNRFADEEVGWERVVEVGREMRISAQTVAEEEEARKLEEVGRAYKNYQMLKVRESVVDFGDLLILTNELLRKRPSLLRRYQQQFRYVLVDEFQDTNLAQYRMVRLLAQEGIAPQLTVVGDDSQSIYRFRGAAIENILEFMDDYPDAKKVVLNDNFRSDQVILDAAYRLIQNNNPHTLEATLGIDKKLISGVELNQTKVEAVVVECETGKREAEVVVEKIGKLLEEGVEPAEIAVLARAHAQLDEVATGLRIVGIPFWRANSRGLFETEMVRLVWAFVQSVVNPRAVMSQFELVSSWICAGDRSEMLEALTLAREEMGSFWERVSEMVELGWVVALVDEMREKIGELTLSELVVRFIGQSGVVEASIDEPEGERRLGHLRRLVEYIQGLEKNGSGSLMETVEMVEELMENGENPSLGEEADWGSVMLSTVHGAKGLEFEAVFVVSVVAGRFPAYGKRDLIEIPAQVLSEELPELDQTAEERRLFYVAMTRAKRVLWLSWARDYGGARKWKPSGFLEETGLKRVEIPEIREVLDPPEHVVYPRVKKRRQLMSTSFTQIDTFRACPLRYKYKFVLKIPTQAHHALSFGKTIHAVLYRFHSEEMQGKKPGLERLLEMYQDEFDNKGFESVEHREERFRAGEEMLRTYQQKYRRLLARPWKLEQEFRLRLGGTVLVGKIDRIDEVEGGYEIVDYKTGSSQKAAQVAKDEQLSVYTLALEEVFGLRASSQAFYFIEENIKVSSSRNHKQLAAKRKDLERVVEQMQTSQFEAKPGYVCQFCEFRQICPQAYRG